MTVSTHKLPSVIASPSLPVILIRLLRQKVPRNDSEAPRSKLRGIQVTQTDEHFFRILSNLTYQEALSILGYPDQMILDVKNSVLCPSNAHAALFDRCWAKPILFRQAYNWLVSHDRI